MAAIQSMRFIPFVPPSNPSLYNRNTLRSTTTRESIPPLTSSQKLRRPPVVLSRSGGQSWAERNAIARAEGWEHALADNGDESDDDLPSLEELLRIPPRPTISDKASRTEPASQHLDQPALNGVAIQADRTKSGIDQLTILDDDEPEEESTEDKADNGAGDIETGHTELDASTLKTSERASRPKSTDISGPWYDVEEERYVNWPALKFGPRTPQDVSCSPAPDQTKTLLALSIPPQEQINEQCVCDITLSSFEEFGASSSNQNPNDSKNGWTEDQEAELENELTLALVEQGNPSSTSAPSSPYPRLADAPQDNAMTQECTETTSSRPQQQREASRLGTPAQGLEEWEQQETQVAGETLAQREPREEESVVDRGEVEMQQQEEVREFSTHPSSHAQSKINLRHPATPIINGHRHILHQSANPSGPSGTALCDKTVLGNPGEKRGRRDTNREIGSESLCSNDSDNAYDKGDDDLPPAKRRKLYEAPALIASPRFRRPPSSTSLEMGDMQSRADDGCPSTSVDIEQHHTSHTSWNSSMAIKRRLPKEDEEFDELAIDDYSQQGNDTDGSENSADEDHGRGTSDEDDEDFRPAKQSKLPSPPYNRHRSSCISTKEDIVRSKHICYALSKAGEQMGSPQNSPAECVPFAEYQEFAVNGVFKCITIGKDTTFNLELQVAGLSEHFDLRVPLKAMSSTLATKISSKSRAPPRRPASSTHHCKTQFQRKHVKSSAPPYPTQRSTMSSGSYNKEAVPKRRARWTEAEEAIVVDMRKGNASWKEISVAVPSHSLGSITGHYYGTLNKKT